MANISDYLKRILSARYGKDVRQSIHDAIQQCYYDGKAGSIDLEARQSIEDLNSNLSVIGSLYNGETLEIAFESGYHVHEIGSITLPKGTYIIYFGGYNPISNRGTEWADTLIIKSPDGNENAIVSLGIEVYVFNGMAIVSHDSVTRYSFVLSSWESEAFTTAKNWSIKAVRVK